jgi:hypothetical protein
MASVLTSGAGFAAIGGGALALAAGGAAGAFAAACAAGAAGAGGPFFCPSALPIWVMKAARFPLWSAGTENVGGVPLRLTDLRWSTTRSR